jgi:hypothetical protein
VETVRVQRVGDVLVEDVADQELRVGVAGLRRARGEDQVRADTDRAIDKSDRQSGGSDRLVDLIGQAPETTETRVMLLGNRVPALEGMGRRVAPLAAVAHRW